MIILTYKKTPCKMNTLQGVFLLIENNIRIYFPQYFFGAASVLGVCDKGGLELSGLVGLGIRLSLIPDAELFVAPTLPRPDLRALLVGFLAFDFLTPISGSTFPGNG